MQLSAHFSLAELTFSQTAARLGINNAPDDHQVAALTALCNDVLEPLRLHFGKPIRITSGYRCPQLNKAIGGSPVSAHCKGLAADIVMPGIAVKDIAKWLAATTLPFDQVIYEFGRWVHVSTARHPRHEALTARHSKAGTLYATGIVEV